MVFPDKIRIIENPHQFTLKEKGSEFIANAFPISTIKTADETIASVKKKLINASHYCYAYRLLDEINKYSDDGEPAGSAGIRILNAIDHFELTNIIIVVTRYFGGTKFGVGPLGKAYYNSVFNLLNESTIIEKTLFEKMLIKIDFPHISHLYRLVSNYKGKIEETNVEEFSTKASYYVLIKPGDVGNFISELTDLSGGKAKIDQNKGKLFL